MVVVIRVIMVGRQRYLWRTGGAVGAGAWVSIGPLDYFSVFLHISQLKSTWELGKIKGLKLEELWLEDNPLCRTFSDQSMYFRSV